VFRKLFPAGKSIKKTLAMPDKTCKLTVRLICTEIKFHVILNGNFPKISAALPEEYSLLHLRHCVAEAAEAEMYNESRTNKTAIMLHSSDGRFRSGSPDNLKKKSTAKKKSGKNSSAKTTPPKHTIRQKNYGKANDYQEFLRTPE
jgi:hypothetical protein